MRFALVLLGCSIVVAGCECSAPPASGCASSSECRSGMVCVDGTCRARTDAGRDDSGVPDADGDGIDDVIEGAASGIDTDADGTPDAEDTDSDDDGIPDRDERGVPAPSPPRDTDGDGTPDFRDTDSDADGIDDAHEGTTDGDGDARPDYVDRDSDDDGLLDAIEGAPLGADGTPPDTDGDGAADFRDVDADGDALLDGDEGAEDVDGDGIVDFRDPRNDGPIPTITLTAISTAFNSPIGIDYHEPTNSIVLSVNYSAGVPLNFERIEFDGSHEPFSMVSGLTDEVKIGTVRSGNPAGFVTGDLFVGNGIDGQITRVSADGATVTNPWVDLPGDGNGLMRGSLYVDRTGVLGGDLVVATTLGQVWRITADGTPTMVADVGDVHLEGVAVVPDAPARFGPLAGRIIAGAEEQVLVYAFALDGTWQTYDVGVAIEDIEIVPIEENFFGVNFGTSRLLGAPATEFEPLVGDIMLTQETHSSTGLYILRWDGTSLVAQEIPRSPESAPTGQWEHVTFAPAGIVEIPPLI